MSDDALAALGQLEQALASRLRDRRIEPVDRDWLAAGKRWAEAIWCTAEAHGPLSLKHDDLQRGLTLAERPVFVCGTHRSGTTWMRNLLDGHPQLIVLPSEGSYYPSLHPRLAPLDDRDRLAETCRTWLLRLANPENQPPFWLLGRTTADRSGYVDFARALAAWWPILHSRWRGRPGPWALAAVALAYATTRGAGRLPYRVSAWVDKTPTNERFLAPLRQTFPGARIIQMIRDPRAVIASHKALGRWSWRTGREAAAAYRNLAASYSAALEQCRGDDGGRYLMVRYEELAAQPEETARRIADFLGIENWNGLLEPTCAGQPAAPNTSFPGPGRAQPLGAFARVALALTVGRNARRLGYWVRRE